MCLCARARDRETKTITKNAREHDREKGVEREKKKLEVLQFLSERGKEQRETETMKKRSSKRKR